MKTLLFIFSISIFQQAGVHAAQQPVKTADSVNLTQYLGRWFEIAAIPQSFEKQCIGNTTADYALAEDELISVVNSCDTASGKRSISTGRAKVVDKKSNSKLKVTFVNAMGWQFLLGGDYWILAIGENYTYAVVGAPGRDYAWILSRTPGMSEEKLSEASKVLVKQGFDTCKMYSTVQSFGLQERSPLCQIISGK